MEESTREVSEHGACQSPEEGDLNNTPTGKVVSLWRYSNVLEIKIDIVFRVLPFGFFS